MLAGLMDIPKDAVEETDGVIKSIVVRPKLGAVPRHGVLVSATRER
jgi:hypothetical protein